MQEDVKSLPVSASNFLINISGWLIFLFWLIGGHALTQWPVINIAQSGVVVSFLWLAFLEIVFLKVHKRKRVNWQDGVPVDIGQIKVKVAAFLFCLLMLIWFLIGAEVLWTLFLNGEHANPYGMSFNYVLRLIPLLTYGGVIYICLVNDKLGNLQDNFWHLGNFVLGRWKQADLQAAKACIKSVFLRFYYAPLMLASLLSQANAVFGGGGVDLIGKIPSDVRAQFMPLLMFYFLFSMTDVLFAFLGYISAFRPLDTDIRSTEPTLKGWFVCLICYEPFWLTVMQAYFFSRLYSNGQWYNWFSHVPPILGYVWGTLAILAMCTESFSTLSFGMRFSNLTYRGLVSDGLYRWTRHPQYVSKMLNRFMVFIPILSTDGLKGSILNMLEFSLLMFIYFLRARTEENHLSRYPEYVEYAEYIDKRGIFRFMNRILPFLKFDAERASAGRIFN